MLTPAGYGRQERQPRRLVQRRRRLEERDRQSRSPAFTRSGRSSSRPLCCAFRAPRRLIRGPAARSAKSAAAAAARGVGGCVCGSTGRSLRRLRPVAAPRTRGSAASASSDRRRRSLSAAVRPPEAARAHAGQREQLHALAVEAHLEVLRLGDTPARLEFMSRASLTRISYSASVGNVYLIAVPPRVPSGRPSRWSSCGDRRRPGSNRRWERAAACRSRDG